MKFSIIIVFIVLFVNPASAWEAKCTISGKTIQVFSPVSPSMIAKNGNYEIQFKFIGKSKLNIGEVTGWLSKCYGKHCPMPKTRTFELNTFSNAGLLYCYPIHD